VWLYPDVCDVHVLLLSQISQQELQQDLELMDQELENEKRERAGKSAQIGLAIGIY
jgi:hypothetical protein